MHNYTILCKMLVKGFTKHNIQENSAIISTFQLTTDFCDIEPILSDYQVAEYKVIDCDYPLQIMKDFKKIPAHYYETIK